MKKIIIMALVAMIAASAFAQNPEALKAIKKAKSADEAMELIKANESSMSAAENAQAYNKVVDIYMKDVQEAVAKIEANNLQMQMGQEPKENVDTEAFYDNLQAALVYALICDKYDMQPNEKDKIAPKFRKANADRLFNLRIQLLNAGQDYTDKGDSKRASDVYKLYVETGQAELFAEQVALAAKLSPDGVGDVMLSEVARVASYNAFQDGDKEAAMKYLDVLFADPDPEKVEEGIGLKVYYLQRGLETPQDSINALNTLKEMHSQFPQNEDVFSQLVIMYGNVGQVDNQKALIDQYLTAHPDNLTAWALKGQIEMNDNDYDGALADYKKALSCESNDEGQRATINYCVGYCLSQKVNLTEQPDEQMNLLKEATTYLEEARQLDPDHLRCNWPYLLYQCYYLTKGENDPATVELQQEFGY